MNLAYAMLHQMNMNLLKNIASITASYAKEHERITQLKLDTKIANSKYEVLIKTKATK